ncbi:MAG TPA: maleylpyruvate isomerase family mycothiol-dependent enzyme [Acidothermaceae bacterium]|nr:maleylpyruvate isomerase family mycothiol-dependent enzyme [Acidothermaceae bacterium]
MTAATPTRSVPTRPRVSTLDRPTLMVLAEREYDQFASMLGTLAPEDWSRPTDCPGWDVRAMASHVLGMAEMAASVPKGLSQARRAKRRGGVFIDALTALQVEARTHMSAQQVVDRLRVVGPKAARARRRIPSVIRNRRLPIPQPVGEHDEDWMIGYLTDTILTRDTWMHRIDITRATNRPMQLSASHDGKLTADVVKEWAARHGQPCELHLTGAAGGRWSFGTDGPSMELDAIEFNRTVSGREQGTNLLQTAVPF